MSNGCICCTVRGDLLRSLFQLLEHREKFDTLMIETTGLVPLDRLAVARSRRAGLAKQLLEQTDAPSTRIAFASGFGSVRAYHATLRRLYGRSPGEIRANRLRDDASNGGLSLRLAYRPPLAWAPLLEFLERRAVPGVEQVADGTYSRSVRTGDRRGLVVRLTPRPAESLVSLGVGALDDVPLLAGIVQGARRLLDLDADPAAVDGGLGADPVLEPLVERTPGLRLPGCFDGFELAVRAIVGQQVSLAGARTTLGKVVERLGSPLERPAGSVTHLFPTAERLAEAAADDLGMPRARAGAIRRLATLVSAGDLDLSGSADPQEALATLMDISGVGTWTAAYVATHALRDPDAFPAGDLGVRRAARALGLGDDAHALRLHAERWRPWRGYAAMYLWQAAP